MYKVITKISFAQQPSTSFPLRNKIIVFNFCHELDFNDTWETMTNSGTITLPKKMIFKDAKGKKYSLNEMNLGGFNNNEPLFLRGDKVSIDWGYLYFDSSRNQISPIQHVYDGYISEVLSKKPFVIKFEDEMWILKQKQATGLNGRKFFSKATYTMEGMLQEMMQANGLSYHVNALTSTTAGDFITANETIAQVLARMRKDYNLKSYFKNGELRIGSLVYLDADLIDPITKNKKTPAKFIFQRNRGIFGSVISDSLEYQRKEDIEISTVAKTTDEALTGKFTKDGLAKTKKVKLEVLITFKNGSDTPIYYPTSGSASTANPIPDNTGGQRFTDTFPMGTSLEKMKRDATNNLRLRYYTGFKGKFTTFGTPFVQQGDDVDLLNPALPEMNGRYKVKGVSYKGGVGGLRQEIELDYLVARLDTKGNIIKK